MNPSVINIRYHLIVDKGSCLFPAFQRNLYNIKENVLTAFFTLLNKRLAVIQTVFKAYRNMDHVPFFLKMHPLLLKDVFKIKIYFMTLRSVFSADKVSGLSR